MGLNAAIQADHLAPRGDAAAAVTALYEAHAMGLVRLAVVMLGDLRSAEDVVQDAFCGLHRRWRLLDDPGKALQYARSSVLNGCRSQLRARARSDRRAFSLLVADAASPEEDVLVAEEHREVLAALRRLPARQREALVLRFYLDLSEPDIAAAMAISQGTVKSTTSRALTSLGRLLRSRALAIPPPFYVALLAVGSARPRTIRRTEAVVARTATGARLAVIAPPAPDNAFAAVSGSPDGREFVLAAERLVKPFQQNAQVTLYELRIDSGTTTLTRLPVPPLHWTFSDGIALSPDGSQVAYAYNGSSAGVAGLRVYDLATGKLVHDWPVLPPGPVTKCCVFDPRVMSPSWEANGRYLALDVTLAHCEDCVALLDTDAAGASVQAISQVIVRTHNRHYPVIWTGTIIAPDGSVVVRSAAAGNGPRGRNGAYVAYLHRYSATSGRKLWQLRGGSTSALEVLWSSASGRSLVVGRITYSRAESSLSAVVRTDGHGVPVPLPARTVAVAW